MIVILILLVFMIPQLSRSQELDCDVSVNYEKIRSSARDYLFEFENHVRQYLNSTRWTDDDLGGEKIKCSMNILFENTVGEHRYVAKVFIGSLRPVYVKNDVSGRTSPLMRILDERWEFTYVPNQPIVKDDYRFDPLADFLDFYAYVILGLDFDTYDELSGTKHFQRAYTIANQAGTFAKDWQQGATYNRIGFINEIMNLKYQSFRLAFFQYHFQGVDLLGTQTDEGLANILAAIESIGNLRKRHDPRSLTVRVFFETKYMEIAEAFRQSNDRSAYERIVEADPLHLSTYQEFLRK